MNVYRICVYAICKNEAVFVERWLASMGEADEIVVLDTGSTDDTAQRLRDGGAQVKTAEVYPWRFDTARNLALGLVPEDVDICVCTDLDEVFHSGWRAQLEAAWTAQATRARYRYTWSFRPEGGEGVVFWAEKIHARHGYRWVHPVHEVLEWVGPGAEGEAVTAWGVQLDHHPDSSKSRGQYLPLLELSVQEDPDDDRNWHYLGREYLYQGRWDDCIATLLHHLSLPRAVWPDERAASMRFLARAYWHKGAPEAARNWYLRAIAEAPHLREAYVELAWLLYTLGAWEGVLYFTNCALAISQRPQSYICEDAPWGSLPHDLQAVAYAHTNRPAEALSAAERALELEPGNARLLANVEALRKT